MIFFHYKAPRPDPRPLAWAIVLLAFASALATYEAPVIGLSVIGAIFILSGIYVEMNAQRVWDDYYKMYKKNKKKFTWYNRPTMFYYVLNTYIIVPLIMIFGLGCLVAAYKLI